MYVPTWIPQWSSEWWRRQREESEERIRWWTEWERDSMPYKSEKQRKYMHAKHPEIAKRWDKETGGKVQRGKKKGK